MASVNKVILLGRAGKDPESSTLGSGVQVTRLSLATSESFKDRNGQKQEKTEWHNLTFWRGLGEVVDKYVKKGDQIYVEGKIQSREYTDKEGVKRRSYEIVADSMTMLGGRGDNAAQAPQSASQPQLNDEPDDLPF